MPSTTNFSRGDIIFVPFPFTDLTTTKQRPGLVISSDAFNASHDDVVLLAITSQVPANLSADEFLIPQNELRGCGLPKASLIRLSKVLTLHQRLVIKHVGTLPPVTLAAVLARFRAQF
ncbi:MAG TPA: type II toxin-antitoxin system PemK/MazF family toxin [Candidatus Limnocylindria bacterium]|nr:type II toxin-antitoxin system PemK/MazF family toxin [Candidatus Limnocylindria bacterium]